MHDFIDNIKKIQFFIFILIPILLITGPFLSDLSVVTISLIFIFITIAKKKWKYYKNIFFKFFIIWYFCILISSLTSENVLLSLESTLFYLRFCFFSLGVWFIIDENDKAIKYFLICLIFSFSLLIFDGFLQYFTNTNLLGYAYNSFEYGDSKRISSFFGTKLVLGKYLSFLFPLFFALIAKQYFNSKLIFYLSMLILILTDTLVYLSGERSAFALLVLATILIIILSNNLRVIRIITFSLSIILLTILSYFNENIYDRMITHTTSQIYQSDQITIIDDDNLSTVIIKDKVSSLKKLYIFSAHHQSMYAVGIKMFIDKPLFGVGPKLYRQLCKKEKFYYDGKEFCSTHPHNIYVQLLAETGIVGTIPILIIFFMIIWIFIKHLYCKIFRKDQIISDYQVCLLTSFVITLWPIIPSQNLFNNWNSLLIFIPLGFLLQDYYSKKNIK